MSKNKNSFLFNFLSLPRNFKNFIVICLDIFICFITLFISFYFRLGSLFQLSGPFYVAFICSIIFLIPIFVFFGLYKTIFRYFVLSSVRQIFKACFFYGVFYSIIFTFIGVLNVPRTIGLINPILLFIFICASRLFISGFLNAPYQSDNKKNLKPIALVYGAGSAGRQLISALKETQDITVVGFLDDDPKLQGLIINGLSVYSPSNLKKIIKNKFITHLFLAIPSANRSRRKEILNYINNFGLTIRSIPSFTDIASGKISVKELRDLEIDDLLDREIVEPNIKLLKKNITSKRVLVTGAGGSIGSELCRQIIQLNPEKIILVEISEYALYSLHSQLELIFSKISSKKKEIIIPLLSSVQDKSRINEIISTFKPDTIYHAAAYKHVPIVEQNLIEGIKNNIFGTIYTAESAVKNNVKNFVLISTDKAVRPTNVMGASKRFAEICLQALFNKKNKKSNTIFSIVRFGNVLDSSGSVLPKFRNQIKDGGPITLTHPDVTRFFMTIPEAAQLVIQAGALSTGGEVFVLDMGEPVKIANLAKRMIKLSGLTVKNRYNFDGDIEIKITGLRQGEKLYEELLIGDNPEDTIHPKIKKAKDPYLEWHKLSSIIKEMNNLILIKDEKKIIELLKKTVIGFNPSKKIGDLLLFEKNKKE